MYICTHIYIHITIHTIQALPTRTIESTLLSTTPTRPYIPSRSQ